MLTLYFSPGASSMAPHIALHEVGAPFESRAISLARKENRAPGYLAINPEGKVPTLLIDLVASAPPASSTFAMATSGLRGSRMPIVHERPSGCGPTMRISPPRSIKP